MPPSLSTPPALSLSTARREDRRSFPGNVAIMGAAPHVPMAINTSLGVSLLVLTLLQAPGGQALEPLETKWRESIEADLRNGDPTGQVCTKLGLRHRPAHLPAGCRRRQSAATATPGRRRHQSRNQRSHPSLLHLGLPAAIRPRRQGHRRRAPAKDFHRGMRDEL
jgi:hypothetical protein